MTKKQMRAVVVGATTVLGKELAEELNTTSASAWDLRLVDESDGAEAQLSAAGDEPVLIQPLNDEAMEGADLVFFAGEPEIAREYWRKAVKAGASIVDLTGALEGEAGFLVRSSWISGGAKPDLTTAGVVSAHPGAVMLAVTADRLQSRFGLQSLSVTVLEPASQAGKAGLDELHQQTVSLLSFQTLPKDVFDTQVAFNLQSSLGEASRVQLSSVRDTVKRHLGLLLGAEAAKKVRLEVIQAPVFHGYTVSGIADLAASAREDELRSTLNGGLLVIDDETVPSNLAATESGDIQISVRPEADAGGQSFWLWMAADNLRLAARNAIGVAAELVALRPSAGVQ